MEVLHRTFTNKIFIVKTYPNAYSDANATIASLASAASDADGDTNGSGNDKV